MDIDEFEDPIDLWPIVPAEFRPKSLPHVGAFTPEHCKTLRERGYAPIDARFLEGQEKVKALLEASLLGTANLTKDQQGALRLASEVYGLRGVGRGKSAEDTRKNVQDESIQGILEAFNKKVPADFTPKKKAGRPKEAKDKKPRKLGGAALQTVEDNAKKGLERLGLSPIKRSNKLG